MRPIPYFTVSLLAAAVLTFVWQMMDPSLAGKGAVISEAVRGGEWYRIGTGALLHGGSLHLLANAYFAWGIGSYLESQIGSMRLIVISLAAMLGSGLSIVAMGSNAVGLSGVLYGWLASWFAFHLTSGFPGLTLSGPRLRAYLQLLGMNLLISLLPGISLLAHAGGFVGGFLAALVLGLIRSKER